MVKKLVNDLNNGINKGDSYIIIDNNALSFKILYILQRHHLISSFKTIDCFRLLVIFVLFLFVIMLLIKYILFNDKVLSLNERKILMKKMEFLNLKLNILP